MGEQSGKQSGGEIEFDELDIVDRGGGFSACDAVEGAASAEEEGEEERGGKQDGNHGDDAEEEAGSLLYRSLEGLG